MPSLRLHSSAFRRWPDDFQTAEATCYRYSKHKLTCELCAVVSVDRPADNCAEGRKLFDAWQKAESALSKRVRGEEVFAYLCLFAMVAILSCILTK